MTMSRVSDLLLIAKDIGQIAADLLKCQAKQLAVVYKQTLTKILAWLLIALSSVLLAIGGLGMILWGAYIQLAVVLGPAGSAYILGAFLLLLAIIIFLLARSVLKD